MAILLTPLFLSLGPYCVTTFGGDHTMKMCHFLLLAKWLPLRTEKNSTGDTVPLTQEGTEQGRALPPSILQTERITQHGVD